MSVRIFGYIIVLALTFLLTGCDGDASYAPPAGLPVNATASITGTKIETKNPLLPDTPVFLVAIDGMMTNGGWTRWNAPILVTPGQHLIEFAQCFCNLIQDSPSGAVAVDIDVHAGESYYVTATPPRGTGLFQQPSSTAWIEDSEGNPVSQKIHFNLVSQTPSISVIPIFLPTK